MKVAVLFLTLLVVAFANAAGIKRQYLLSAPAAQETSEQQKVSKLSYYHRQHQQEQVQAVPLVLYEEAPQLETRQEKYKRLYYSQHTEQHQQVPDEEEQEYHIQPIPYPVEQPAHPDASPMVAYAPARQQPQEQSYYG